MQSTLHPTDVQMRFAHFNARLSYCHFLCLVNPRCAVNMKYIVLGYQLGVSILFDTSYLTIENTISGHI